MNKLVLAAVLTVVNISAFADQTGSGPIRRDSTYVTPHSPSSVNNTTVDSNSTRGGVNPYPGQQKTHPNQYSNPSQNGHGQSSPKNYNRDLLR
ncbi:MAG: hypothetical protein M3Q16_02320 [Pseudomonadota bacterium]|nr:hypothetical protein [Pseudomonadota bacterium]